MTIDILLKEAAQRNASDLHIYAGKRPIVRVDGALIELDDKEVLDADKAKKLVYSLLNPTQQEKYEKNRELDLSHQIEGVGRFRINLLWEKEAVGLVARLIPEVVPAMDDIALPDIAHTLTNLKDGLVLVTGPAGSGKSTTLASMIDHINGDRGEHIITLEDPIEFLFHPKKSLIRQRQLGQDMLSFKNSLRYVLRQDPNVIMVGEMRDLETISSTVTLAETGHLVFATLHTYNAAQTISRIVDVFPPEQQTQIRLQLATTLKAIISQRLVVKKDGGRVAVREVLINTPAVATLIRENKLSQLETLLQTNGRSGMVTMDQSIKDMYEKGLVDKEEAQCYMQHPASLDVISDDSEEESE